MPKFLLVARQAYLHEVRKKSFLIASLAPVGIVALTVIIISLTVGAGGSRLPLGLSSPAACSAELSPPCRADKLVALNRLW